MTHDGYCLFRALSYGLYGRQGDFLVELNINVFVVNHWKDFKETALYKKMEKHISIIGSF